MGPRTSTRWAVAAVAAAAALATASGPNAAADSPVEIVASGLNSPRGIAVAPNGDIFVAESGVGGTSDICWPNPEAPDTDVCYGPSGAITRINAAGMQERVVTGLPSMAGADGSAATGPSDVVTIGNNRLAIAIGLGAEPAQRDTRPAVIHGLGTIVETTPGTGRLTTVADVAAFEGGADPDGAGPDSNPTSLVRSGSTYVVTDAGGNSVVRAKRLAGVSALAVLPGGLAPAPPFLGLPDGTQIPYQSVPTSVTRGPDDAWYVGQLTGFPFPAGGATIYRVGSDGSVSVYASGLSAVTDLAFAEDGRLYAVQMSSGGLLSHTPGSLVRVPAGSSSPEVVTDGLAVPYGLAVSGQTAYVTTGSVFPGGGQVVKISLGG